jgi:hypothetical protein
MEAAAALPITIRTEGPAISAGAAEADSALSNTELVEMADSVVAVAAGAIP